MPSPHLPPGFDPTDPDTCVQGLPVEEFAELRKAAPIWWCEQTPGRAGGFNDGGYWVVTKHKDVKEVSRRSDVFSSYENGVIPRFNDDIAREDIEVQRFVMLNMDAPHHTRLRKIISRGFTPRAVERLRDELSRRAENIAKTAAAQGAGDFVEQVSCELPLQAIAGLLGVPQEDRMELFRWSNEMTGNDDPEFADVDPKGSSVELIMYAMKMADDQSQGSGRGHRDHAGRGRHRRREAVRRRVRLLRRDAGRRGQRDHPQLHHPRHGRLRRQPRSVGAVQEAPPGNRGRRDCPVGDSGHLLPAHRASRTPNCPACRSRRASGW